MHAATTINCRRCGRPLKEPASVSRGLGPACRFQVKKTATRHPGADMFDRADYTCRVVDQVMVIEEQPDSQLTAAGEIRNIIDELRSLISAQKITRCLVRDQSGEYDGVLIPPAELDAPQWLNIGTPELYKAIKKLKGAKIEKR